MSLFYDKKYEEMDWLAKAVEPVISSYNDFLSTLPDEFTFNNTQVYEMMFGRNSWNSSVDAGKAYGKMNQILKNHCPSSLDEERISRCFELIMEGKLIFIGGEEPRIEGDGVVKLVKIKSLFEEEELKKIMAKDALSNLRNIGNGYPCERANEILELIGGQEAAISSRSPNKKLTAIVESLTAIMEENKWNIRNTDLADKIVYWIQLYLKDGNLAAMANFCKIKVMTHSNDPIYSLEEEPV